MMQAHEKKKVFDRLAADGFTGVTCHFSGGNDDGGVDSYEFYTADRDGPIPVDDHPAWTTAHAGYVFDDQTGRYVKSDDTELNALAEFRDLVERPIYEQFYTFAGDFYVNGTLVWDVTNRTVEMQGEEQVYEDRHWDV